MTDRCFVSHSSFDQFGERLDSRTLPIVGEDRRRHARRAQVWRRIFIALAGFWLVILGALIVALA
ncbi:hypothetical protein [Novosphingobium clariflavum]|uniref:Uncharacterized protein n=1 Tax=Novosphingobium clariflavum TaxID=2029884 RepID=A0ABV6SC73_9SPHN|nr:hypothetical protein [Novosphingobium clariflavum]